MRVLLLTNLYPSRSDRSFGTFVKITADILSKEKDIELKIIAIRGRSGKIRSLLKYLVFYIQVFFYSMTGKYDLAYIHFYTHIFPAAWLPLYLRKKKYVINIHGGEIIPISALVRFLRNRSWGFLKNATEVIVPSTFFKAILVDRHKMKPDKIFVWPSGGVNDNFFLPLAPQRKTDKMKIGYVSRIDYGKGWDVLLKAVFSIDNWPKLFELHFVGGGKEESEFKSAIESYWGKSIFYYGSLSHSEIIPVFEKFDLFVFPTTLDESLGLVGLEAMALGIPVIASECSGIAEYLINRYNGLFFAKGNTDELKDRILQFHKMDFEEYVLYKKRARETALKFKSSVVAEKLIIEFKRIQNE